MEGIEEGREVDPGGVDEEKLKPKLEPEPLLFPGRPRGARPTMAGTMSKNREWNREWGREKNREKKSVIGN